MKRTQYLTAVVRSTDRLEIEVPNLTVGQTVEVIVITPDNPDRQPANIDRRTFLKLPLAERRRLLEQQAEAALPYYQEDSQWCDWVEFDIANTYE
jgi:hypothetical protein